MTRRRVKTLPDTLHGLAYVVGDTEKALAN